MIQHKMPSTWQTAGLAKVCAGRVWVCFSSWSGPGCDQGTGTSCCANWLNRGEKEMVHKGYLSGELWGHNDHLHLFSSGELMIGAVCSEVMVALKQQGEADLSRSMHAVFGVGVLAVDCVQEEYSCSQRAEWAWESSSGHENECSIRSTGQPAG